MSEPITIGGVELTGVRESQKRLSVFLWGLSGCGKTTLAGTAPGKKLLINFDPDGPDSLAHLPEDEVDVLDFSTASKSIVEKFKEADPLRIGQTLLADDQYQTVIVDSTTVFSEMALAHGVVKARTTTKGKNSTEEDPGFSGYGNKNLYVNKLFFNMLTLTAKFGKHIIIIGHEDKPLLNDEGGIVETSIMLGSSLKQQTPIKFSEVWHMSDQGSKGRIIRVRPWLHYRPMKTRMFKAPDKNAHFVWDYDIENPGDGVTLAGLYDQWIENEANKIPLP